MIFKIPPLEKGGWRGLFRANFVRAPPHPHENPDSTIQGQRTQLTNLAEAFPWLDQFAHPLS